LYGFATELRTLAYTMPGGHEDPLIRLSERMGRHAQQQIDEDRSRSNKHHAVTLPPLSGGDDESVGRGKTRPRLRQNSHPDSAEIGPLAGWEQMTVGLLRLRFATCVCLLAAALLMGAGGGFAIADPGSSSSAANGDDGTNAGAKKSKKPKDESGTDTKDGSPGSGGQSGQPHSIDHEVPKDDPGGTDTKDRTKPHSALGAAVADPVAEGPNEVAPVSVAVPLVPNEVAPVSVAVPLVPNEVAPVSTALPPVPDVVGPVSDVNALVEDMLTSVTGAVVPLTQLSDLYSFLLGVAKGASVSDVSALVQEMLHSVVEAVVLLAQVPADLSSFLLDIAGVQSVVGGAGGIHRPVLSAPADASVASRLPLGLPPAGVSGVPVTGEATGVVTLDVNALGRASAMSGMGPLVPDTAPPISAGSSFRHVLGEILVPVSLWALAVAALPGLGGLVMLFATGTRLGYRQAKAGFALRAAGIASPGAVALGVVRSRSLVVIRPTALRVVGPTVSNAGRLLDEVA
jgi:hypothetical protein